ncbi:MAG TPA: DUF4412 domain-containing protein [Povalibacter sp.]|jgi:hypothetical protein
MSRSSLTIAIVLLATSAHAGTVMESVSRDLSGNRGETLMTTYAQNGQMRVDGDRDGYAIFKDDGLYAINTKDKNYVLMDRATMKKMADTINPAMKQMQERMAQMTPEQRAQMEAMMGRKMPGMGPPTEQEIRKTARTDKVAGYSCSYVEVLEGGVLQDELCVVAPASLKGGDELMASAQKVSTTMREIFKDIDAAWIKQMVNRQMETYAKIGGLPVLTRHFSEGKAVNETTLKSIRSESISATTFAVPAGYTRKDLTQR